jgi:hypothetical protein
MTPAHRIELSRARLEQHVGAPLTFEELKHKPGRRLTVRASGPRGRAVVKLYASGRAPAVAARVAALAAGPSEPLLPRVLFVDPALRLVALSYLPGAPLRAAVLAGDQDACGRAGAAIGAWHRFWRAAAPPTALAWHTAQCELEILRERASTAPRPVGRAALQLARPLLGPWPCSTVVHRDLYEEQLLLGKQVALIDLDDAAFGPPELDLGNLLAHLDLLEIRSRRPTVRAAQALLSGYRMASGRLNSGTLDRCRRLSRLRLACIHGEPSLLETASAGERRRSA